MTDESDNRLPTTAEQLREYANALGCALVTAGPGGTNALTGVACAWIE